MMKNEKFVCIPPAVMVPTTTAKPVTLRLKKAKPSAEQRQQSRADALHAAQALQADINTALNDLHVMVQTLAVRHNCNEAFITEQIHLGGHIIKQKRAPGINNAYAHCEARCENECKLFFLLKYLTVSPLYF